MIESGSGGSLAPVALFVYNRPHHTRRTLEALSKNRLARATVLHVFSDGPARGATPEERAAIDEVRRIAHAQKWCAELNVHERDENAGLADLIRGGVSAMLVRHPAIIVLEDDIETSSGFLEYMNHALASYRDIHEVMHVSGYLPSTSYRGILPSTFRARHMSCWGWATWADRWSHARWDARALLAELDARPGARAEFDMGGTAGFSEQLERNLTGELDTWAVFWAASIFLANGDCLFPRQSLVRNTGTDGSGVHFTADRTALYDTDLADRIEVKKASGESRRGRFYLRSFFRYGPESGFTRRARLALGRAKHSLATRLK